MTDDYEKDLVKKSTLKVDTSVMAYWINDFYSRKVLCAMCKERGAVCPYNYDTLRCVYGDDMEEQ